MSRPDNLRQALPGLRRTLQRFAPLIRRERRLIGGGAAALLGEVAFRLLEPWPLKIVIDGVLTGGSSGVGWIDGLTPVAVLVGCGLATLAAVAGRAGLSYLSTIALALAGNRILTRVRGDLYAHLQSLSLRYHDRARTGDLLTRLTGDIGRLQEVTVTAAMPLVVNVVTFAGMAVVMVLVSPLLALLALGVVPVFAFTLRRVGRRIRAAATKQRTQEGELASVAAEALGTMTVVHAYSLQDVLQQRFESRNGASLKEGVKGKRLSAGLERRTDLLVGLATAGVVVAGGLLVLRRALTLGELVIFLTYLKSAFKPLRDMAKYTGRIAKAGASGERIVDVLDAEPEITDAPFAREAPTFRGDVRLQDVTFGYDPLRPVVHGVTIHARPGQRIGIVGASGAGKSSILGLLPRLYDPVSGRVLIDGQDITGYTVASLRAQIALVLQDSLLFATTVRENIRFGCLAATDDEVVAAARLANAHEFVMALPDGYDTVLGERGATLSGGQRQRIAIARAAIRQAAIVLLDEPTSGLDGDNEREVLRALDALCQGRTTFVVAHDLAQVRHADQIVVVDDGRVVETGSHDELVMRGGLYARMVSRPLTVAERRHAAG